MDYTYVGLVLVNQDGSVLVQHRDDYSWIVEPGKWSICGGRVEEDDLSDEIAAIRELFEETGYLADPGHIKKLGEDMFYAGQNRVVRRFYWTLYDGIQKICCYEGQEIKFLHPWELASLDFCDEFHRHYLEEASKKLYASGIEHQLSRK